MNILKHRITLPNGSEFHILHNLEEYAVQVQDYLMHWLQTGDLEPQSLCDYLIEKAKDVAPPGADVYCFPDRQRDPGELDFSEAKIKFLNYLYKELRTTVPDKHKHQIRMKAMTMVQTLEDTVQQQEAIISLLLDGMHRAIEHLDDPIPFVGKATKELTRAIDQIEPKAKEEVSDV